MSFERPITIKEVINEIHKNQYFLPSIQREFVWDTDQIEQLFDSMLRDYPIGSFLFWIVDKDHIRDFKFYEFIRDYHERDNTHNPKASVPSGSPITAVLDGQQRLTAIYNGLMGSYAKKLPWKRWDNDKAFPKRYLCLNLLNESTKTDLKYDFRYLTKDEYQKNDKNTYWFKVGKVLDMEETSDVNDFLVDHIFGQSSKENDKFANQTLFRLHQLIHNKQIINYFRETEQSLDKVLNIFIRVNSGGTVLSYSDLLLSIATAEWKNLDAREVITNFVDDLDSIGGGFNFNKDFVLKSCLVLSDFRDIAFKVDNFNAKNMKIIENNWNDISNSIHTAVQLVSSYGYQRDTLTSNNALIPIAYYIYKNKLPDSYVDSSKFQKDRDKIFKWLIIALLKRTFGGQPDNVLRPIRQVLQQNIGKFPFEQIIDKLRSGTKSMTFNFDELENLLDYNYGQKYTFSTLALLYPTLDLKNKFHVDHIFPKKLFSKRQLRSKDIPEDKIDEFREYYDYLGNLQLLEGTLNHEKSSAEFEHWLSRMFPDRSSKKEYMKKNLIPDVDLSLSNFIEFFEEREKLILNSFKELLKVE